MNFGDALDALKAGERVAREGWNGKGMYVRLCREFETVFIEPFFLIKNVKDTFNTWVPSVSDLMAEDWGTVE